MAKGGWTYTAPPFIDQWADSGATDGTTDTAFLAPLDAHAATRAAQETTRAQEAFHRREEQSLTPNSRALSEPAEYNDALDACESEIEPTVDPAGHPSEYYDLLHEYHQMVLRVDGGLDSSFGDAYRACMADQGQPYNSHSEAVNNVEGALPPLKDRPAPGQSGDAAWVAVVNKETAVLGADVSCRSDAYSAGMASLAALIPTFRYTHASALAAEAEQWTELVRRANELPGSPGF